MFSCETSLSTLFGELNLILPIQQFSLPILGFKPLVHIRNIMFLESIGSRSIVDFTVK